VFNAMTVAVTTSVVGRISLNLILQPAIIISQDADSVKADQVQGDGLITSKQASVD
jgi:hypothetical protein